MRILLVEDEPDAAQMLAKGLREQTYAVDLAPDVYHAFINDYDFVILDCMLPRKDGFNVCRQLRAEGFKAPILMLTARDGVQDRVTGFDSGADDYLIKPFTAREYALLEYFARRVGEVDTRSGIAEHVWDESFDPFSNLIEVYVNRLRSEIDFGHALKLLRTRRGEGYILTDGSK